MLPSLKEKGGMLLLVPYYVLLMYLCTVLMLVGT